MRHAETGLEGNGRCSHCFDSSAHGRVRVVTVVGLCAGPAS
jgi:hypothetical protein